MIKKTQSFITRYLAKYKRLDRFSARFAVVTVLIGMFVAALFVNLFRLMVLDNEKYQQQAALQQLKTTVIPADRGTIYDINGNPLVESAAAWLVVLDPKELHKYYETAEQEEICHTISEILGMSYETVLSSKVEKKDKEGKTYTEEKLYFTKMILAGEYPELTVTMDSENPGEIKEVFWGDQKLKRKEKYQYIKGVSLVKDTNRYYYNNTPVAANVIGYTNFDNEGSVGIESYYDSYLKGVDGKKVTAKNSKGGEMPYDYTDNVNKAINGNDITLTIDVNVQTILEKYLRQAVIDNDVQNHAAGIIMNVNTGAVLAMATMPDYDPANYQEITDPVAKKKIESIEDKDEKKKAIVEALAEQWRNKAVNDTYEPGSVFKPITMSSALEEGVTDMDDTFVCKGYRLVGKRKVKCAKTNGHGHETLTQAMMNSCNPVLMELGSRLGKVNFSKYFKSYGLTAATGIDLPGESSGMYIPEEKMTELDLAICSFGQSMTVTPIQMITAMSAVVNGGYLLKPYVVSNITDADGNIVKSNTKVVKRQVISEETSAKMRTILEATANKGGTAHNVYLPGYRIGKYGLKPQIIKSIAQGQDLSLCTVASVLNTVILKVDAECALAGFPVDVLQIQRADRLPLQHDCEHNA